MSRLRVHGHRPWVARLRWVLSWEAIVYAISTFPFFIDLCDGRYTGALGNGLNLSWVRVFRIFNVFRTSEYNTAVNTVLRVLLVNRTILLASLALVLFMILLTATLIYSVAEDATLQANAIDSIPDAMYLAVLMLTGQAIPEAAPDQELNAGTRAIVILTAFLSVPIFAVPAAMLTWGFEGEAARLACREQRRFARRQVYREGEDHMAEASSSDSDSSEYEEYLRTAAGADGFEEDREAQAEVALHFFAAARVDGASRSLAHVLKARQLEAARERYLREDALHLIESTLEEKADPCDVEAMEGRLAKFAALVRTRSPPVTAAELDTAPGASTTTATAASTPGPQPASSAYDHSIIEAKLQRLEAEMTELRASVTTGMGELRNDQAELLRLVRMMASSAREH